MPLDVDRIAEALLEGTKALIAKELGPLRAENAALVEKNAALEARLSMVEARKDFDPTEIDARISGLPDAASLIADAKADLRRDMAGIEERMATAAAPDLSAIFAALGDVESAVDEVRSSVPAAPDLSGFVTRDDLAAVASTIPPIAESPDLSRFATLDAVEAVKSAIPAAPDLSGFVRREDVSAFATKAEVDAVVAMILPAPEDPDLSGFATLEEMKAAVAEVRAAIPQVPKAPDLTALATKDEVAAAIAGIRLPDPVCGKDGAGVVEARQNADGELILKLTTGDTINAGRIVGRDGLGFEDMAAEYDGERTVVLRFRRGDVNIEKSLVLPILLDRGVWREGEVYQRGDCVTWAGSLSIAQRETSAKPEASDDWRLAVRKGRDGKASVPLAPRPETVTR